MLLKAGTPIRAGAIIKKLLKATKKQYKTGDVLGSCIFLRDVESDAHVGRKAAFLCACGNEFVSRVSSIKNGTTKSCGCLREESASGFHKVKPIPELTEAEVKRFWSHVTVSENLDDCWNWESNGERYGSFHVRRKQYKSNRLSYYISYMVDPGDMEVMHSCDNPKCCNPNHLSLGTHKENMEDMVKKFRFRLPKKKQLL